MNGAILITGGARRLGKATALYLARHGHDIALHYHTSRTEAEETAHEIEKTGVKCVPLQADLADTASYNSIISKAHAALPALSALVNNASVFERGGFLESDAAFYQKEFRINLEAPMFLTQAFAKQVKKGCVVNLLDSNITRYKHLYFFYLLSKKTLSEFTKMAAVELGPEIRVNGVCPGFVLPSDGWGEEHQKKLEAILPLKKIATPEDIAIVIHLMINTPSLTGQVMFVDGGESLVC